MIRDEIINSFVEYLSSKDIVIVDAAKESKTLASACIDEEKVREQLLSISEFHKKVAGYKGYMGKRLDNKTGSTVEQYKINIKRLRRYLKNIRINSASSNFERVLLRRGSEYIQRAEAAVTEIYNSGYLSILERSMKRNEICLGNTDFTNLRAGEKLAISSLDKCAYNNVEMDCFYLLSKLKRKGLKLDFKGLTNSFCEFEGLEENSSIFILALLSYPYSFMKCCNRYRERTKEWSEEEYEKSLQSALNKDGDNLLGG